MQTFRGKKNCFTFENDQSYFGLGLENKTCVNITLRNLGGWNSITTTTTIRSFTLYVEQGHALLFYEVVLSPAAQSALPSMHQNLPKRFSIVSPSPCQWDIDVLTQKFLIAPQLSWCQISLTSTLPIIIYARNRSASYWPLWFSSISPK